VDRRRRSCAEPLLTPGKDSRNDYVSYTHNFSSISKKMRSGCPAILAKRLGAYWTTTIGKKSVVVFKSDSHMSQDGPELPNIDVWRQIIQEVRPALVLTTGTAGGIGKEFEGGRRHCEPYRPLRLHGEVQEAAICTGALHQLSRECRTLRHCTFAIQNKCGAASKGKPAPSEDRTGAAERPWLLCCHDRLLRLRHVR